jgi:PAS domain S-box-containing protein
MRIRYISLEIILNRYQIQSGEEVIGMLSKRKQDKPRRTKKGGGRAAGKTKPTAEPTLSPRKEKKQSLISENGANADASASLEASQQVLRESEKRYKELADSLPQVVFETDEKGNLSFVNRSGLERYGYTREDFDRGLSVFELIAPEDRDRVRKDIRRRLRGEELAREEYAALRKDGSTFPIVADSRPVVRENKVVGLRGIVVDITERKLAEEALEETNRHLETLLDHTHMMVAYLDPKFDFVRVNRAYAEADGRKPSFFPGKNHFDLYPNAENEGIFRRVVETGEPYFASAKPFEYAEHPERGVSYWDWSLIPIKDSSGAVTGLVLTLVNVTERHRAEAALKSARAQLEIRVKERTEELTEAIRELQAEVAERRRAEEMVKVSEQKYKTLVETSNDMIFTVDLKGNFLFTNRAFGKVLGYSAEEITKINGFDLVHPEDLETVKAQFARLIEGDVVDHMEYRYRTKDGSYISILNNASPVFDPQGNVVAALGAARDISGRKRAEEALQKSEDQLRLITDALPVLISYVDSGQRYRFNNKAYEEWFGHSRTEVCGRHIKEVLGESAYQSVKRYVETVLSGQEVTFERVVPYKDAGPRFVNANYIPHFGEQGEVKGFFTLISDITERKRTEKALQESELWMRNMYNSLDEAVFVVTPDRTLVNINQSAQKMFGYTRSELVDLSTEVLHVDHQHYVDFGRRIKEAFDKGETANFEFEAKRKNGEVFPTEHTVSLLQDDTGQSLGIVSVVRDISERRRAEEEVKASENKYRTLLENLPQRIFLKDKNSVYLSCNENLARDLNIKAEEIVGKTDYDFLPKELADKYRADDKRIMKLGKTEDIEERYIQDGQEVFVHTVKTPVKDERGNLLGLLGIFWDITERKRTEEQLREYRDHLEQLVQDRTEELSQANRQLRKEVTERKQAEEGLERELAVNRELARLSGALIATSASLDDMANLVLDSAKSLTHSEHGFVASIDPETGDQVAHTLTNMMGKQCLVRGEDKRIRFSLGADGLYPSLWGHALNSRKAFLTNAPDQHQASRGVPGGHIPIRNFLSVPAVIAEELVGQVALANSSRDYTDLDIRVIKRLAELYAIAIQRKRAEEEVQKRTRELDERVRELDCLYGIASLVQKPGVSLEEILAGTLELIPPAWRYPEITCARLVLEGQVFKTDNFQETAWRQASDIIVRDCPVGTLEVFYLEEKPERDEGRFLAEERSLIDAIAERLARITERKKGEQEIQELNESLKLRAAELAAANKELEAFSYSVSHDLRAPLRTVEGFSTALMEDYSDKLDEEGKDYLSRVRAASQHMKQLIDDLLNLSLTIRREMRREETNLSEIAHAVVAELKRTQPGRQVEFVIQEGMLAHGDPRLFRDVLENLLGNAWKFTEKHPRAKIEFGLTQEEGHKVYFVRDDGAGFDQAYVDKLFVPFQRLHSTAEFSGNGVGLAVVSRIINRHGGRIWAEGEVEKGATFFFTLS